MKFSSITLVTLLATAAAASPFELWERHHDRDRDDRNGVCKAKTYYSTIYKGGKTTTTRTKTSTRTKTRTKVVTVKDRHWHPRPPRPVTKTITKKDTIFVSGGTETKTITLPGAGQITTTVTIPTTVTLPGEGEITTVTIPTTITLPGESEITTVTIPTTVTFPGEPETETITTTISIPGEGEIITVTVPATTTISLPAEVEITTVTIPTTVTLPGEEITSTSTVETAGPEVTTTTTVIEEVTTTTTVETPGPEITTTTTVETAGPEVTTTTTLTEEAITTTTTSTIDLPGPSTTITTTSTVNVACSAPTNTAINRNPSFEDPFSQSWSTIFTPGDVLERVLIGAGTAPAGQYAVRFRSASSSNNIPIHLYQAVSLCPGTRYKLQWAHRRVSTAGTITVQAWLDNVQLASSVASTSTFSQVASAEFVVAAGMEAATLRISAVFASGSGAMKEVHVDAVEFVKLT